MPKDNATPAADVTVAAAAQQVEAFTHLTAPQLDGQPLLADTVFPRMSVQRRVLGYVTDGEDSPRIGPRNTLAALTYSLMTDRTTTHPPEGRDRLEIEDKTIAEITNTVNEHLNALAGEGLVAQRDDGSYVVTDAGRVELDS